ncbi:MAG TPA: tRNA uridine-5-carboxymethylaminomethyl(34) synthesis enzyme MnmG [Haploplasma sp.]|nr:tRNA uridine-5-carboxymethylaminomethyl(34) synthesis enzyme MnmG [Haploplasma sp.]
MIYDSIVVGGGHAGVEAALALAKMNKNTLLVTGNLSKVASLPCNPSFGGPAKGIVVREIDALGGLQAKAVDEGQIQMKMLNASKGPAVRALRAQVDKITYPKIVLRHLKEANNLELLEDFVDKLIIEDNEVKGIILENGKKIFSKTVIITTGTYLRSSLLVGLEKTSGGPEGERTTKGISKQLEELGFELVRLKTGTPPRLAKEGIDFSKFVVQPGAKEKYTFSYDNKYRDDAPNADCYLLHTTEETHRIINENLDQSSMYGGLVEGVGPRYCPSIEDKVVRFSDKNRHQIFLEPESMYLDEIYVQGLSTSLPREIQHELLLSIPGLENAVIRQYAYAIEYDAINPLQLKPSLETKQIKNLFCAGQINGTSGYEEAACQGLMAGINAGLNVDNKDPFILKRSEAYIGLLIDDLVTKGTKEPYRLLTSRSEYRLLLRNDNADLRLTDYGYELGLVDEETYANFNKRKDLVEQLKTEITEYHVFPTEENNAYLESRESAKIFEKISILALLKRPEINKDDIKHFLGDIYPEDVYEQVEIQVKYEGYITKALKQVDKMLKLEEKQIPATIDYKKIPNLSHEGREKLMTIRPKTLGQASRIIGVNPPDISILSIYMNSEGRKHGL